MAAIEYLCRAVGIDPLRLSKEENQILEAELFLCLCNKLMEYFKEQLNSYFRLMKFTNVMENEMIETNFIRCIINDLINTETYNLSGIAIYTQTPEEIIHEIAMGKNSNPSLHLARKIIELHRSTRPDLYKKILEKSENSN